MNGIAFQPNSKNFLWLEVSFNKEIGLLLYISRKTHGLTRLTWREFKEYDHSEELKKNQYFLNLRTRILERIFLILERFEPCEQQNFTF